jgi:nickel transport protein
MKNSILIPFFVLLLLLHVPTFCLAHRVNIHAWLEGGDIRVSCGFNRGMPAKNGRITVYDAGDGSELLTGLTDAEGMFDFPVPDRGRKNGLRISINAGAGHESHWDMDASELQAAGAAGNAGNSGIIRQKDAEAPASPGGDGAQPSLGSREMEKIVAEVLDAKLVPLRRDMAALVNREPGLQEVVGGLGWIVGLAGIILYFRSRKKL